MESLTYLYVLAEEAEYQAKSAADSATLNPTKRQESLRPMLWEPQAPRSQSWVDDDCDRTRPAYPTFYL